MKTPSRLGFVFLTLMVLTLGVASAARADTTIKLLPEFVGETNPGFEDQSPECDANATGQFQWVFALVWIDKGTPPGVLTVRFEKAGVITNSSPVLFGGGNMQRWWIFTNEPDTLLEASATVPTAQSGDPRAPGLKLSSIRSDCKPKPPPIVLASAGVDLGACAFDATSLTPATITVTPPGGAVVTLRDSDDNIVTTTSQDSTLKLAAGAYHWTAVATEGYTIEGLSSGSVVAGKCAPAKRPPPTEVLPRMLPETGVGLGLLAAIGFGFVGLGALMLAAERKPAAVRSAALAALAVAGAVAVASFPLLLLPVLLFSPGWRRSSRNGAAAWVAHASFLRPVMAVSRGGIWRPALG